MYKPKLKIPQSQYTQSKTMKNVVWTKSLLKSVQKDNYKINQEGKKGKESVGGFLI